MTEKIKVALVDDQAIIRKGLIKLFENHPHIQVVCEANNGKEIVEWFEQNFENSLVDIVLMCSPYQNLQLEFGPYSVLYCKICVMQV